MVLNRFLLSQFSKLLISHTLIFSSVILASQLFSTFYLIISLPLNYSLPFLVLLFIYTLFISLGFSLLLTAGNLIFFLKEVRFFHTLYTFGFSERKVLKILWMVVALFTLLGIYAAFFVNYQKISQITKYLKFKFDEEILLTIPPKTFYSTDEFSFYFERREGNSFKHLVVRLENEMGSAKEAKLDRNGILELKDVTLFGQRDGNAYIVRSKLYKISLKGPYYYYLSKRKLLKETAFTISLYLFPLLAFPLFFYTILKRAESRFSANMWSLLFVTLQFIVALTVKALF